MTPHDLIAAFETLADAPDGVTRLRELVLQLAVGGKLVPQNPEDEPASVLLGDVATLLNGYAFKSSWYEPDGVRVMRNQNVLPTGIDWSQPRYVSPDRAEEFARFELFDGDIVLSLDRPLISSGLKVAVVGPDDLPCLLLQRVACLRPDTSALSREYLFVWLRSPEFIDSIDPGRSNGVPHISTREVAKLPVRLPSRAQQARIVQRVDELMGLLDRLEAARDAREATRGALRDAALAELRDAHDAESVQVAWARIAEHMDDLFTHPDDVAPLRQTILQLAVRGRLVPHDPDDEPASVLLERIAAEKARLVKEKKVRKPKKLPPIEPDEVPFEVPEGWEWARLQDVLTVFDPNPSHRYPSYTSDGIPLLSTREFDGRTGWNPTTAKRVPEDFWHYQRDLCGFAPSDIVFARKGRLGLARPVPAGIRFTFSHTVFVLKVHDAACPGFWVQSLQRESVVGWLLREMNSNTGVPTLGKAVFERMPIAVPPVNEQMRITARLHLITGICDKLSAKLASAHEASKQFASAAVQLLDH